MPTSTRPRSRTRTASAGQPGPRAGECRDVGTGWCALVALLTAVTATGCLDGLEPPFGSDGARLACSSDLDARYLSAAGSFATYGVTLADSDPPAAIPMFYEDESEPGFGVIGSSQEGEYQFYILNAPAIREGSMEVVRNSIEKPDGVRLVLELERGSLGSVSLDSLMGEITFERADDEQLAGHFEASFGTPTDQFIGCFNVDVLETSAQ